MIDKNKIKKVVVFYKNTKFIERNTNHALDKNEP